MNVAAGMPAALAMLRSGPWIEAIQGLMGALRANHQPADRVFLTLGDRLGEAVSTTAHLTTTASDLAGRLGDPRVQDTLRGLDGALLLVDRLTQAKGQRGGALTDIGTAAAAIQRSLAALEHTIAYVRMLGVNARIEVSQFSGDASAMNVFSHEIVRLATHAQDAVAQAQKDLAGLAAAARQAAAAQQEFESRNLDTLSAIGERLTASIGALHRHGRQAHQVLDRLPKMLEEAQRQIAAIVSALQIGDIARQRAEHVEHGLQTLIDILSGAKDLPETADPDRQLGICVSAVGELQARQLDSLAADLSAEASEIRRGFDVLADRIATIDGTASSVYGVTGGGETFLTRVERDVGAVAGVVEHYCGAIQAAEGAIADVNATASAMVRSMDAIAEIDAEMSLIGLNASIKCGNLGVQGVALNVVAQELRQTARQTGQLSGQVSADLHRLLGAAKRLSEGSPEELAGLKRSLADSMAGLRAVDSETTDVLSQIGRRSGAVIASVRDALTEFDADQRYRTIAATGVRMLRDLSSQAQPSPAAKDGEREAVLQFLEGQYTMDRERDVHRRIVGGATAAASTDEDLADILF